MLALLSLRHLSLFPVGRFILLSSSQTITRCTARQLGIVLPLLFSFNDDDDDDDDGDGDGDDDYNERHQV